jgi:hypothetical protein
VTLHPSDSTPRGCRIHRQTCASISKAARIVSINTVHEDFRARVLCVDDHLAIGRPGDFDSAILQICGDGNRGLIASPHIFGFRQKFGRFAGVQIRLSLLPSLQKLFAPLIKVSVKRGYEFDNLWD